MGSTSAPAVPTMLNAVPRLIHRLWRSPFPEGEGFGADLHAVPENQSPESTEQELPLGEAGSPAGETDEGAGQRETL